MSFIKKVYDDIPENIPVPQEFVHKKEEVIIILQEDGDNQKRGLKDFFGVLSDCPERELQGEYENRQQL